MSSTILIVKRGSAMHIVVFVPDRIAQYMHTYTGTYVGLLLEYSIKSVKVIRYRHRHGGQVQISAIY
jgi:hypothetical protein